jgi:MFS superfamily sulfate permease-like transporter
MGVFGLGIVSSYFSHAFISGYTCGSAVQVLTSQIKDVFGLKGLTKYNGAFKIPLVINIFLFFLLDAMNFC